MRPGLVASRLVPHLLCLISKARLYLELYLRLIASRIRSQMQYRVSFVLELIGNFLITFTDLAALMIMFIHAPRIGGWSLGEIAFLYALSALSFSLSELFQGAFDADVFADYVRRGNLDQLLTRPLPLTFQVLSEYFVLRRLGRMAQALVAFGLAYGLARPDLTPLKLLYLALVIASGALFFLAISIAGCTLCFWTVQSIEIVNIFTYGGTTMLSYPITIYQEWMQRFFVYILPLAFINYFPALYLLDKANPFRLPPCVPFLAPPVCVAAFLISLRVWRIGVSHYQSTGS
jgi:ABC-2 type transport system permease protein